MSRIVGAENFQLRLLVESVQAPWVIEVLQPKEDVLSMERSPGACEGSVDSSISAVVGIDC